jgi:phosphohistidine swiveling domain-containing protein
LSRRADTHESRIDLGELSAFAGIAWEMLKRHGISTEMLSFFARSSRRQFETAGGIEGLRSVVEAMIGGPGPRPVSIPQSLPPRPGLAGVGLGAGRAEGPARVFTAGPPAGQLLVGEILVCTSLDPGTAARLKPGSAAVVETGSPAAAPVRTLRDRGVPVVRLRDATMLIDEGTVIGVDGGLGRIDLSPA